MVSIWSVYVGRNVIVKLGLLLHRVSRTPPAAGTWPRNTCDKRYLSKQCYQLLPQSMCLALARPCFRADSHCPRLSQQLHGLSYDISSRPLGSEQNMNGENMKTNVNLTNGQRLLPIINLIQSSAVSNSQCGLI